MNNHIHKFGKLDEMEINNLPRLNHEEIKNLNRSLTRKETESIIKKLPLHKASLACSIKHLKTSIHFLHTLPKL
jgi:hypothetical protein